MSRNVTRAYAIGWWVYLLVILLFIIGPLLVIISVSFTSKSYLSFPPNSFSLRWYKAIVSSNDWLTAMRNSLTIAILAAIGSTSIGGIMAIALDRYDYTLSSALRGIMYLPILIPAVIVGVAFVAFFRIIGFSGTLWNVAIAHSIFYSTFPFILISQGLDQLDSSYEEAAMSLKAPPWKIFRTITLPLISPNVLSGAIFAFILSLNDYLVAWLLAGFTLDTIPIKIFNTLRYTYSPIIASVSVAFIIITFVVIYLIDSISGGVWS